MVNRVNPFKQAFVSADVEEAYASTPKEVLLFKAYAIREQAVQQAALIGNIEQQRVNPFGALIRMMDFKLRVEDKENKVTRYKPLKMEGLSENQRKEISKNVVGHIRNEEDGVDHFYRFGDPRRDDVNAVNDDANVIIEDEIGNERVVDMNQVVNHNDLRQMLIGILANTVGVPIINKKEEKDTQTTDVSVQQTKTSSISGQQKYTFSGKTIGPQKVSSETAIEVAKEGRRELAKRNKSAKDKAEEEYLQRQQQIQQQEDSRVEKQHRKKVQDINKDEA